MRLVLAALSRPLTVVVALDRGRALRGARGAAHARRHLSAGGRSGHLCRAALRRHGPGADGRLPDLLLRVSLPLHHGHRSRGEQEHSGRGAHEAGLSRRHRHEPGDVGDGRLRQSRARVHAAGNGAAVHHALRRRQRRGRATGLQQPHPHAGRDAGFRAQPRAPTVRDSARRLRAAALRRQPADHRHHAGSGQAAAVPDLTG